MTLLEKARSQHEGEGSLRAREAIFLQTSLASREYEDDLFLVHHWDSFIEDAVRVYKDGDRDNDERMVLLNRLLRFQSYNFRLVERVPEKMSPSHLSLDLFDCNRFLGGFRMIKSSQTAEQLKRLLFGITLYERILNLVMEKPGEMEMIKGINDKFRHSTEEAHRAKEVIKERLKKLPRD